MVIIEFFKSVSSPHMTMMRVEEGAPVYLVFFVDLNAASLDFESVVCFRVQINLV